MKRFILVLIPAFCSLIMLSCIEEPTTYPNTKEGNFEALWHLIDTRYCYLTYKAIDWDSIYVAYKAQLDSVPDEEALFDLMADMLNALKDGHVNLYSTFDKSRYWAWFQDYPANFDEDVLYSARYLGRDYRIAGGFYYTVIDGGRVGYMRYESFQNEFSEANLQCIFKAFNSCDGLVVDVRNNGGGSLSLAEDLASYFMQERTLTGYLCHKTGDGHDDFSKPVAVHTPAKDSLKRWNKRVVVLTNRLSYSATNSFVCRMKLAPNALIMGDKTGGGGGMPLSNELPNGWMVRFSACPLFDADMQHTEWGLDPDVAVQMDETDLTQGYDTYIERAITWINTGI